MQVVIISLIACVAAQSETEESQDRLVAGWLKVCMDHAQDYAIHPRGQPEEKFKLLPKPIFRHSQPIRGDDIGAVYLWVEPDDRPAVIGTVFAWSVSPGLRNVTHEFHSLADMPLTSSWRGRSLWSPRKSGLAWKPIPGAGRPAKTTARQRLQIRQLARRFEANSVDPEDRRWELRLVPRPVYNYTLQQANDEALAGAVLLFCQGTDPEIVLLIEARPTDDGPMWHYACAAFSDYSLSVRLDDEEVWKMARKQPLMKTSPHWWETLARMRLPDESKPTKEPKGETDRKQK